MQLITPQKLEKRIRKRKRKNQLWQYVFLVTLMICLSMLAVLGYRMISQGIHYLDVDFLTNFSSRFPEKAGIYAALVGSVSMLLIIIPVSVVLGIGTAIYLTEYARKTKFTTLIQLNIANLAGVPSIVFGLLGLTIFVRMLAMGKSLLAAGLTLSLLILPIIIVTAQEAIRAVPVSLKEASYGMGATKWQTIWRVILPHALPGMLTGTILALSRAIGETAPLVVIGIPVIVQFLPNSIFSEFTALPMLIFDWAKRPQEEFQYVAAAGILVLMTVLIVMNGLASWIRNKFRNDNN